MHNITEDGDGRKTSMIQWRL